MNHYVTPKTAREILGVSNNALKEWDAKNLIKTIRTPGGKRLYDIAPVQQQHKTQKQSENQAQKRVCYCRVSAINQKTDLEKQIKAMQELFPEAIIITDIGSGINFKRKGLRSILEQASKGSISEVVVTDRDRLCWFAFELIEWMLQINGVKLMVLNQSMGSIEPNSELIDDVLAIINVFNCRINGQRRYHKSQKQKKQTEEIKQTNCQLVQENPIVPRSGDQTKTKIVVRLRQKNI
jgi:predicted site-specific integrase-resolvase